MRKRREAMQGTKAEPRARRFSRRMSLIASTLGLLVFLGSAQAASAWHLTSVSPTTGCPGATVTFTGTSFSGTIHENSVERPKLVRLHVPRNNRESHELNESHRDHPALSSRLKALV